MTAELVGFRLWAASDPELTAIVTADDRTLTYGELFAEVNRISHALRERCGLVPGDTIASVMTNSAGMVALYLAAMQSGVYLVTVNYHLTEPEVAYILSDSETKVVFASERSVATVLAAAGDGVRVVV